MNVSIDSVRLVARWTWDVSANTETCAICRRAIDDCCPNCRIPGDDCPLATGRCTHSFHLHCIEKWTERDRDQALCPMCRRSWEYLH